MPHPDRVFDALLLLLRAGLWEQLPPHELRAEESGRPTLFPLTADEWAQLYGEACKQTVVGIVWQGVSLLPQEFMPPHATTMRWVAHVDAIERHNATMHKALASLLALYKSRGIEAIVLKGDTVAALYPMPELRQSGDIDLYFPMPMTANRPKNLCARMDAPRATAPTEAHFLHGREQQWNTTAKFLTFSARAR